MTDIKTDYKKVFHSVSALIFGADAVFAHFYTGKIAAKTQYIDNLYLQLHIYCVIMSEASEKYSFQLCLILHCADP